MNSCKTPDDTLPSRDSDELARPHLGPTLTRGSVVSRYIILERLGQGGMGVVYKAYDPDLDRQLAIKFHSVKRRNIGSHERAKARLFREAQALAKLAHPNVVNVYDVGTFGDDVFVAMELIPGQTLKYWLKQENRSFRQIVQMFAQVGQGLIAAHDAGIVHRDFKPSNVIVGNDNRPRVLDFGLAAGIEAQSANDPGDVLLSHEPDPLDEIEIDDTSRSGSKSGRKYLNVRLTQLGATLGTPRYMSPEQYLGLEVGERSDQFSFCVALYEALYRTSPFASNPKAVAHDTVLFTKVRKPPQDAQVGSWLEPIVLRGLSKNPNYRFESMRSLLEEMQQDPEKEQQRIRQVRQRNLMTGTIVFMVCLVVFGAILWTSWDRRLCSGAPTWFSSAYNDKLAKRVQAAIRRTNAPYAELTWQSVANSLSQYQTQWIEKHTAICKATRVTGEQSEELLDQRMHCLDQNLDELRALVRLFAQADRQIVQKAVQAIRSLPPLSRCDNRPILSAQYQEPKEESSRAQTKELKKQLARVIALKRTGKYKEGLGLAQSTLQMASTLGHRGLEATAQYWLGVMQESLGSYEEAEKNQSLAYWQALGLGYDLLSAQAANSLTNLLGYVLRDFEQARSWSNHGIALIQKLGKDKLLLAQWNTAVGSMNYAANEFSSALTNHRKALALRTSQLEKSHPDIAESLNNIGASLDCLGKHNQALDFYQQALAIRLETLGPNHPDVAQSYFNLAYVSHEKGEWDQSIKHYQHARRIYEKSLGSQHYLVGSILNNLAVVYRLQNDFENSKQYLEKALHILQSTLGQKHPDVANSLGALGVLSYKQGNLTEAQAYHQRAHQIRLEALGPTHPDVAESLVNIASLHSQKGQHKKSQRLFQKARTILQRHFGKAHPSLANLLHHQAQALILSQQDRNAIQCLRQSLAICQKTTCDSRLVPSVRFELAKLLYKTASGRYEAKSQAQKARSEISQIQGAEGDQQQIEAWLQNSFREMAS